MFCSKTCVYSLQCTDKTPTGSGSAVCLKSEENTLYRPFTNKKVSMD